LAKVEEGGDAASLALLGELERFAAGAEGIVGDLQLVVKLE